MINSGKITGRKGIETRKIAYDTRKRNNPNYPKRSCCLLYEYEGEAGVAP
jgi:hypothetical protein